MDEVFSRQQQLMERSGMGLLPGLLLAFVIALLIIAVIVTETWWAVGVALAGVFGVTLAVLAVFVKLIFRGDDDA